MTRIRFEDLPSTNTPRNAENLNKLNNVVISSTEPTTGEEVWVQKGKNDLKIDELKNIGGYTHVIAYAGSNYSSLPYQLKPNTEYTISLDLNGWTASGSWYFSLFNGDDTYITELQRETVTSNKTATFTTKSNGIIYFGGVYAFNNDRLPVWLNTVKLQIKQGSTATTYEPYIDKKIYTKNDNGVYEKFYDESEVGKETYSTSETRIGTWIDGKPLYRKVITLSSITLSTNNATTLLSLGISNVDTIYINYGKSFVFNASNESQPASGGMGNYYNHSWVNKTTLYRYVNDSAFNGSWNLTLEYTKTTD